MPVVENAAVTEREVPLRTAMNEVLRDNYVDDCQRAVDKWNRSIGKHGLSVRLALPSKRFHRAIGIYAGHHFDPAGNLIPAEEWARRRDEWLPNQRDRETVAQLMQPVHERGRIASWLAPPSKGINGQPFEYEYVRV
jgi:benzoyl-CoA 2,3-dioxygenase component B